MQADESILIRRRGVRSDEVWRAFLPIARQGAQSTHALSCAAQRMIEPMRKRALLVRAQH